MLILSTAVAQSSINTAILSQNKSPVNLQKKLKNERLNLKYDLQPENVNKKSLYESVYEKKIKESSNLQQLDSANIAKQKLLKVLTDGPSGSGGGNLNEALFVKAWGMINQVVSNIQDFDIKQMHLVFVHTELTTTLPKSNLIDVKVDLPYFLKTNQPNLLNAIQYLIQLISEKSKSPEQIKLFLNNAIQSQVRVPYFLTLENQIFDAVDSESITLSGCRDRIHIQTDAYTGQLFLSGFSSGSCFSDSVSSSAQLSTRVRNFLNPQMHFSCKTNQKDEVICMGEQLNINPDTLNCAVLNNFQFNENETPWIKILKDGRIQVGYVFCSKIDNSNLKTSLTRLYKASEKNQKNVNFIKVINDIEKNILSAKQIMQTVFSQDNLKLNQLNVDAEAKQFLNAYSQILLSETMYSKVLIDTSTAQGFNHFNEETWIETALQPYGEIRVRPLANLNELKQYSPKDFIYWIGHEIAHHIVHSYENDSNAYAEEVKAQKYADYISKIILAQIPYQDLLDISLGTHYAANAGCRDEITVESVDVFKGKINTYVKTTDGHCRILKAYMKMFSANNIYAFDEAKIQYQCKMINEKTICRDAYPESQASLCPKYVKENLVELRSEYSSEVVIKKSGSFQANYQWCVVDIPERTTFAKKDVIYTKNEDRIPLTEEQKLKDSKLENSFGGGLSHILFGDRRN